MEIAAVTGLGDKVRALPVVPGDVVFVDVPLRDALADAVDALDDIAEARYLSPAKLAEFALAAVARQLEDGAA